MSCFLSADFASDHACDRNFATDATTRRGVLPGRPAVVVAAWLTGGSTYRLARLLRRISTPPLVEALTDGPAADEEG
jgi:hypothetical protein